MSNSSKLLPCPICGFIPDRNHPDFIYPATKPEYNPVTDKLEYTLYNINCHDTGDGCTSILASTPEECISKWNSRLTCKSSEDYFNNALILATEAHKNQFDKGGMPYILHPIQVMTNLDTTDIELKCIALLHDSIEDTWVTKELLTQLNFSDRIISGVLNVSKIPGESYIDYKEKVFSTYDSMLVKKADIMHNTDLSRLSSELTTKDHVRLNRYYTFMSELEDRIFEYEWNLRYNN